MSVQSFYYTTINGTVKALKATAKFAGKVIKTAAKGAGKVIKVAAKGAGKVLKIAGKGLKATGVVFKLAGKGFKAAGKAVQFVAETAAGLVSWAGGVFALEDKGLKDKMTKKGTILAEVGKRLRLWRLYSKISDSIF